MGLDGRAGDVGGVVTPNAERDLIAAQRELVTRPKGLHRFIRMSWHLVRPGDPFSDNWSIGAIAEHLEAVYRGQIKRLIINQPPGTMKSLTVCVFWPVWEWILNAALGYYFVSFDASLTRRDAERALRLVQSPWFRARWGEKVTIRGRDPAIQMYETVQGGFRFATSIGGVGLGRHPDRQVIDDPTKPQGVTAASLAAPKKYVQETLGFRFRSIADGARVLIMQRLHEDDLAGSLMADGGYEVVRLPMRYEAEHPCVTCLGTVDPRTKEGELLWPERFPAAALDAIEKELEKEGAHVIAAQMQQRPTPAGGLLFQEGWFGYWIDRARFEAGYDVSHLPVGRWKLLPERFDIEVISLDAAFKETARSDFNALGHIGKKDADHFLTDLWCERADLPKTLTAFEAFCERHPRTLIKLVEDKANGPAVIATLRAKIPGIIAVTPEGGKEARANAVAPYFKAGNFYVPDPAQKPAGDVDRYAWVKPATAQFKGFPFAKNDDIVDMTTQALTYLGESGALFLAAMRKLAEQQR